MTRLTGLSLAIIATGVVACSESPQSFDRVLGGGPLDGKGPPPPTTTSTIADADATVAPTLQYRSDGLGPYVNASNLISQIQSVGDWVLDMYTVSRATRQVYLDFSQPIPGTGPNGGNPVAIPSGYYKVRMISKCSLFGNSFLTLAPGATVQCPLHVAFDYNGSTWALEMNPISSSGNPDGFPETNSANVTCVSPAIGAGPCVGWRITPSGTFSGGLQNEARLLKDVTSKGNTTTLDEGDYYISFSIGVTNS